MAEHSFKYLPEDEIPADAILVATLKSGISDKLELLGEICTKLNFPYFGFNWDALDECLQDLEWVPGGIIALLHPDLPMPTDEANLATYIDILRQSTENSLGGQKSRLTVFFPSEYREQIDALLDAHQRKRTVSG